MKSDKYLILIGVFAGLVHPDQPADPPQQILFINQPLQYFSHYKNFGFTWRFDLVTDKRKRVTVNYRWRSSETSPIPRHTFFWTEIERHRLIFGSSWINRRATIGRGYGDKLNCHGFAATSAVAMSLGCHLATSSVGFLWPIFFN